MAAPQQTTPTRLPLTTIFTPPHSCSDEPYTLFSGDQGTGYWRDTARAQTHCFPTGFYAYTQLQYIPGACPYGWTQGVIAEQLGVTGSTQAYCCPWSMTYIASRVRCEEFITTPTVVVSSGQTVSTSGFTGSQWEINVVWHNSDLESFTPAFAPMMAAQTEFSPATASSSSGATSAATRATLPPQTTQATSTSSLRTNTSSLSPHARPVLSEGAKTGVIVGVSVAVVFTLAMLVWWLLRRRARSKAEQAPYLDDKAELSGQDAAVKGRSRVAAVLELEHHNRIFEASGVGKRAEADASNVRAELEGSWHAYEMPTIRSSTYRGQIVYG